MVCDLKHLGDRGQPFGHRVVPAGLADLEGDERGHLVAQGGRIYLGPVAGDHAAVLQPFQPGLHGAAGDTQAPGGLEHAHPGLGGEQLDQGGVEVDPPASGETVVMVYRVIIIRSAFTRQYA